jgi:ABC-2 type transporter
MFQLALFTFVLSTVFLRTEMHHDTVEDGYIYMGVLFTGLVTHTLYGLFEMTMAVVKLPVFYKQRDFLFYPAWAYAISTWLLKVPLTFLECALYVSLTYYSIGFDPDIHR